MLGYFIARLRPVSGMACRHDGAVLLLMVILTQLKSQCNITAGDDVVILYCLVLTIV